MKRVLIVANGELDARIPARIRAAVFNWTIAVDGGAEHCRAAGLIPDLIVGDLDSIHPETTAHFARAGSRFERHPAEKDATDLELALFESIRNGAEAITLVAVLGGRVDMTAANLLLLAHPALQAIQLEAWEGIQTIRLLRPPSTQIMGAVGDTLSLLPILGEAVGVRTEGLKYALVNETLYPTQTRGLSNVFSEPSATVHLQTGVLLMVHTPGRA